TAAAGDLRPRTRSRQRDRSRDDSGLDEDRGRRLSGPGAVILQLRLGRREPGDRHAIGRAAHVIETDVAAEADRGGIAAMLAANPDLEVRARLAAALFGDSDQLAHAFRVEGDERVM